MRVAYICADPGIPVFGQKGCSIHVQEVIRALRHQGATVVLVAVRLGGAPPADLADLPVHLLPSVPKGDPAVREQGALALNPDLRSLLEQLEPVDWIYERYSLWSYSALEFAQAAGIPGLLEVNAPLIEEQTQHRGLVHSELAAQVAQQAFQAASSLIAVSQEVKRYLERWVPPEKVHVIPNGVNLRRFAAAPPLALPADSPSDSPSDLASHRVPTRTPERTEAAPPFTVGFVGSLKPWHGLSHLVNAFGALHQRVPQARLLIVGDGPQRSELEAVLGQQGLQAVTQLTGAVAPHQIPGLLATMDVAVAPYPPSQHFYFSPLKVVEYMAAGLPVVVSQIGQLAELVTEDMTGLLCPPGDEGAIALALERLWRSPALRHRLGQAARQQILTHHTWDAVVQQIVAIATATPPLSAPPTPTVPMSLKPL